MFPNKKSSHHFECTIEQREQQGSMAPQKEGDSSETKLKDKEDCDLSDRESKTAVMRKPTRYKKHKRLFTELGNKLNEEKEDFTKEFKIIEKN